MASSLEVNKALAALLTAGIIASGSGVISRMVFHQSVLEQPAYPIEVAETVEGTGEATAEPTVSLAALLASGSVEEGQTVVKKCQACHSFEQGGPNKIGPDLWGVLGRQIASHEGFSYSEALSSKGGAWDYDQLNAFITNPKAFASGTKMTFAGLSKPQDRANVILYLRSLSDSPPPLPEVPAAAATEAPAAAATEAAAIEGGAAEAKAAGEAAAASLSALLADASAERGQKATRVCQACHSFEQGGPNKIGPDLWSVLGRKIASHEGFSYSSALSAKEGSWDYETLNTYLADPRGWAPGTKMTFAGIKKPGDRADVILYLRSLSDSPEPLPEGG